jgi:hypothetical protein
MLERMGLEALAAAFDPDREARVEEEPAPGDLVSEFCDQYSPFFRRLPGRRWQCSIDGRRWTTDNRGEQVLDIALRQFLFEQHVLLRDFTPRLFSAVKTRLASS